MLYKINVVVLRAALTKTQCDTCSVNAYLLSSDRARDALSVNFALAVMNTVGEQRRAISCGEKPRAIVDSRFCNLRDNVRVVRDKMVLNEFRENRLETPGHLRMNLSFVNSMVKQMYGEHGQLKYYSYVLFLLLLICVVFFYCYTQKVSNQLFKVHRCMIFFNSLKYLYNLAAKFATCPARLLM